jgi:hypothetical protein
MATKYLRDATGFIYEWNPILAKNPDCVEVTEQEAFPENFIPKKQANRKTALVLETEEIPVEPEVTNDELNQEASRGL